MESAALFHLFDTMLRIQLAEKIFTKKRDQDRLVIKYGSRYIGPDMIPLIEHRTIRVFRRFYVHTALDKADVEVKNRGPYQESRTSGKPAAKEVEGD